MTNKNYYVSREVFKLVCSIHSTCSSGNLTTSEKHHCDNIIDALRMRQKTCMLYSIIKKEVMMLKYLLNVNDNCLNVNDNYLNINDNYLNMNEFISGGIFLWKRSTE